MLPSPAGSQVWCWWRHINGKKSTVDTILPVNWPWPNLPARADGFSPPEQKSSRCVWPPWGGHLASAARLQACTQSVHLPLVSDVITAASYTTVR